MNYYDLTTVREPR